MSGKRTKVKKWGEDVVILDTTYRDGCQEEDVEATNLPHVRETVEEIDDLGIVAYHELGFALSNEAARERIRAALKLKLKGKVAMAGRTHPNDVKAMLELKAEADLVGVPIVAVLIGKTRASDAIYAIRKGKKKNLELIRQFIKELVDVGMEVIFDAEHFFQAFLEDDRKYALEVIKGALEAGAKWIVLCDTNGKMTPEKISYVIRQVKKVIPLKCLGIHCHNDRGRAVVNTETAWLEGVCHLQGTMGGFGERVGNADLITLIANLHYDYGVKVPPSKLKKLTSIYYLVCDSLNQVPDPKHEYVGPKVAFTSAGTHASSEKRRPGSYLHFKPGEVGNEARIGLSPDSGKANILAKAKELGVKIPKRMEGKIVDRYMELVNQGINFGLADASFKIFLLRELGRLPDFFEFVKFRLVIDARQGSEVETEASLGLRIDGSRKLHNAEGDGPVNALDNALRRTLVKEYAGLEKVTVQDFKVTDLELAEGTAAKVRVEILFSDGSKTWTTVKVHQNLIKASYDALEEGYIFKLLENGLEGEMAA